MYIYDGERKRVGTNTSSYLVATNSFKKYIRGVMVPFIVASDKQRVKYYGPISKKTF